MSGRQHRFVQHSGRLYTSRVPLAEPADDLTQLS